MPAYDDIFTAHTVDESGDSYSGAGGAGTMAGPATAANQAAGKTHGLGSGNPSRDLVMLWFTALGVKWTLAYLFRGRIAA